jgi:hypothetical protein
LRSWRTVISKSIVPDVDLVIIDHPPKIIAAASDVSDFPHHPPPQGALDAQVVLLYTSGLEIGCCWSDKNPLNGKENVRIREPGGGGVGGKKLKRGQPVTACPRSKNVSLIIKRFLE